MKEWGNKNAASLSVLPADLKKGSTGVAFELYFEEPSKEAVKSPVQSPPKPSSLDEINKKLQEAQIRREVARSTLLALKPQTLPTVSPAKETVT